LIKYIVRMSIKAKKDIQSIVDYIRYELMELSIARKYEKLIKEEIQRLEYSPQKYAAISSDNVKINNTRKLVVKNYIVFYRINEEEKIVNIVRVLYGRTDWKNKL